MSREYSAVPEELIDQGVANKRGFLSPAAYDLLTAHMPIVCVDFIPVKGSREEAMIGVITRATGPESGKPAIMGGRIQKDETISAAIGRHLLGSLGNGDFGFHEGNSTDHPYYVAQYVHAPSSSEGFDPIKHAIAMTYLINIDEPGEAMDEAADFRWIGLDEIPGVLAYNHHLAMHQAVDFLEADD